MLRKIKLANFKCFEQVDLDCAPFNLLCGLNGMGKSTVIQALLVLRQSFDTGELQNGRLVLGGEQIDLGTGSDVLFEDAERDVLAFTLESSGGEEPWEQDYDLLNLLNESSPSLKARSRWADFLEDHPDIHELVQGLRDGSMKIEDIQIDDSVDPDIGRRMLEILVQDKPLPGLTLEDWQDIPPFGGRIAYVKAERVGPRKTYPLSDMLARRGDFGTSGEFAWNYLNRNQDKLLPVDDPRCVEGGRRRTIDVVDQWLQDVCPGAHLQLEEVTAADAVIAGFTFERPGDFVESNRYRATNVGFGLSYTLPVIVALLSPPGTLCLIENPEAHLHPRGQTKLAELAARAAQAGVQVFAETHSDHFMDGVRIAVRDGLIDPDDAAFHYFERDGNKSIVTSLKADSDGRLPSWPAGFFDQHAENAMNLLAPRD